MGWGVGIRLGVRRSDNDRAIVVLVDILGRKLRVEGM